MVMSALLGKLKGVHIKLSFRHFAVIDIMCTALLFGMQVPHG